MAFSQRNFGIFEGRLSQEIKYFETAKGEIAILSVACDRGYGKPDEETPVDFIEFRAFIPKNRVGRGIYGYLHVGDLVGIQYSLHSSVSEKDGEKAYYQSPFIESIDIKEGRQIREERYEARKNV